MTLEQIRSQRESILACARQHGAIRVRLFGSVARGQAGPGSDVDFLIQYEPERSLIDHISLIESLASLLQVPVDVVSEGGLSPHLRDHVLQDAVEL